MNRKKHLIILKSILLLTFFTISTVAFCQNTTKKAVKVENYTLSFSTSNFNSISITGPNAKDLTPFEVENPKRIVIDIPERAKVLKKESSFKLLKSNCISYIRVGTHTDKIRVVLDQTEECDYDIKKLKNGIIVNFVLPASVIPTPTVTPIQVSTHVPAEVNSAEVTPVEIPTKTPTEVPTQIPTETPTVIPTATPTPATTFTITPTPQAILQGRILSSIEFQHTPDENQVILNLSERVPFRMLKDSKRKYKITINECDVAHQGLLLPHFPPNDVVGFSLVEIKSTPTSTEIIIHVEDGMKATAANIDNSIVIKALPAGF